jgi:glycerol-3-phosphate dehydrogenase
LLDAKESTRISPEVARLMAAEPGKDKAWIRKEIAQYGKLANQYILKQN